MILMGLFSMMLFSKDYTLILILLLIFIFYTNSLFIFNQSEYYSFLDLSFLSYSMVILTFYIVVLMVMSSDFVFFHSKFEYYNIILIAMLISMVFTFLVKFITYFYVFFEVTLIPIFLMIMGWGGQPEKIQASIYVFLYTLVGSLPFFLYLVTLDAGKEFKSYNEFYFFWNWNSGILYILILIMFLVKIPLFMLHMWLPKAHVEAPVTGSMVLAGILLKMGGYGLIQFTYLFSGWNSLLNFLFSLSFCGGIYIGILCMKQSDLKMLIAYSSVVHMGIMVLGLFTNFLMSVESSVYLMLGHGMCSSSLFFMLNIAYSRMGSRSTLILKGSSFLTYGFNFWWFFNCIGNIANPPSLNFFGELGLFYCIVNYSFNLFGLVMLLFFFSSCYSMFLYFVLAQSKFYFNSIFMVSMSMSENLIVFLHLMVLNSLIFFC